MTIFNDQKFASLEAQEEFHARTAHMDPVEREFLYDLMGRISQFLGYNKILTLDQALKHRADLLVYEETEGAEWQRKQAIARGEAAPETKRGRPAKSVTFKDAKYKAAHVKWKDAVTKSKAYKEDLKTEMDRQIEALRRDYRQKCEHADAYVAVCRAEWEALK